MALILPKGIVMNASGLQSSIERIDTEPLDLAEIAKLWKVYTTTQRRLLDPTAERLENYWWRIWGSRKRTLKGATVARLFAQISDGETFVPLRGPPNRDEGTPPPLRTYGKNRSGVSASSTAINKSGQNQPSDSPNSKNQTPLPHPILKKTRGPSLSGPKPTARFISPHDSEDEPEPQSSTSTNSHVVVVPPSPIVPEDQTPEPPAEKKVTTNLTANTTTKKKGTFVASRGSRKKRPVIVRRQNSQSSNDNVNKTAEPSPASSVERTPPTLLAQQSRNAPGSKFQENFSLSPDRPAQTNNKTSRRGNPSSRARAARGTLPSKSNTKAGESEFGTIHENQQEPSEPGPSSRLRPIENSQNTVEDIEADPEEIEIQRRLLEEANARLTNNSRMKKKPTQPLMSPTSAIIDRVPTGRAQILHKSLRSNSDMTHDLPDMHAMRLLHNHQNKSNVSLAPQLTTVTGEVDLGDIGTSGADSSSSGSPKKQDKGKGRDLDEIKRTKMFAKRAVQPVQTTHHDSNGDLSRSKSQLTLMLERDRARSGEYKHDDERTNGSK